jgi:hypothetical protein
MRICDRCKEEQDQLEFASLTPAGLAVLEVLDEIADKWGVNVEDMGINPFLLAGARDEARRAGIDWFNRKEDEWVSDTVEQ